MSVNKSVSLLGVRDTWRLVPTVDKEALVKKLAEGKISWTDFKKNCNIIRCKVIVLEELRKGLTDRNYITAATGSEEEQRRKEEEDFYVSGLSCY